MEEIPPNRRLWSIKTIAEYADYAPTYVAQSVFWAPSLSLTVFSFNHLEEAWHTLGTSMP